MSQKFRNNKREKDLVKKIERRSVTESKVGYQTIHKSICSKPTPREKKILEISMNDNKKGRAISALIPETVSTVHTS
jgi:hypothetical protein